MRSVPRVRSTQKLPIVPERRYENPRTSAIATAMPTAADTKFCTTSAEELGRVAEGELG